MVETSERQTAAETSRQVDAEVMVLHERKQRSEWRRAWRRFARYRPALFGLAFVSALIVLALLPAVFAPYDPEQIIPGTRNDPPSADYWLGNDNAGQDILSRIIYGSRTALIVGVVATLISIAIGMFIGAIAGFFGGWIDALLSRIVDTVMAFRSWRCSSCWRQYSAPVSAPLQSSLARHSGLATRGLSVRIY